MPLEDKRTRRLVERELIKRASLDITFLTVACINRIVYLGGRVKRMRGGAGRGADVEREMDKVIEAIQPLPGVSDVVRDYRVG